MTVLQWLVKMAAASGGLVDFLVKVKTIAPDLADEADKYIAELGAAVTPDNLANLGVDVVKELKDVAMLHFVPKDHPSDGA